MTPLLHHRLRQGFSLIELLVVVAITGLLAMLVFPSLQTARERAKTAACTSNLRQVGVAMLNYAADHDGTLPPAADLGQAWPYCFWMAMVGPYVGITIPINGSTELKLTGIYAGIFRCPGKKDWRLMGNGVTEFNRVSFGMNSFDTQVNGVGKALKQVAVAELSRTLLVADVATSYPVLANSDYMYKGFTALRHRKTDNVLFCDGHVQAV